MAGVSAEFLQQLRLCPDVPLQTTAAPDAEPGVPGALDQPAEEALVRLLRTAADGEALVEQRRVRFCQIGLRPEEAFTLLSQAVVAACESTQAEGPEHGDSLLDRIPFCGLQRWLSSSENGFPVAASLQELARVLQRTGRSSSCEGGDLRYDGLRYQDFVALALPRDNLHAVLRSSVFTAERHADFEGSAVIAVFVRSFKQLLQEELEVFRHASSARQDLAAAMVSSSKIFALLSGSDRRCNATSVAAFATDLLGALNFDQSSALFRCLDAGRNGEVLLDDLTFLVSLSEQEANDFDKAVGDDWPDWDGGALRGRAVEEPEGSAALAETTLRLSFPITEVFTLLMRMCNLEMPVDAAKARFKSLVPSEVCLSAVVFKLLDRGVKGYVAHTDIWQVLQQAGRDVPLDTVSALVKEVKEFSGRLPPGLGSAGVEDGPASFSMALTLRDLCCLLLPGKVLRTMRSFAVAEMWCEAESWSTMQAIEDVLPSQARVALFEVLELAAEAAEEVERLRNELIQVHGCPTSNVREAIARAVRSISAPFASLECTDVLSQDFRHLLRQQSCWSDEDSDLMWARLSGSTAIAEVPVEQFLEVVLPPETGGGRRHPRR
ncbi:unnamed protein product [Polarella glacialis]|uniref:EF-hand domain-containing protein n=1 Tax=Polarella glacialis TaxID=89957 RepID=A0A813LM52_POLGL|nr:unnamed protein product [Polarella glacialis]